MARQREGEDEPVTPARHAGFSLVELLVALALTTVVMAVAFLLLQLMSVSSDALPESADEQQRARAAAEGLWRDLALAGAGFDGGARAGPLARYIAAVYPRRLGPGIEDPVTAVSSQAIAILYLPRGAAQTATTVPIGPGVLELQVMAQPNCAAGKALCGLSTGAGVALFDPASPDRFDLFTAGAPSGGVVTLVHRSALAPLSFPAGSPVGEIEMHSYYLDAATHQLRHNDGAGNDIPVVDHVVALTFEYFGDSPAGGAAAMVPITLGELCDGPWRGSGAGAFDADALRIKRIRVTLRVEAARASLRGTGPAFLRPGSSVSAARTVPDYKLSFEVSPRNLGAVR